MKEKLALSEVTNVSKRILKFNCFGLKNWSKVMLSLNPATDKLNRDLKRHHL